MKDLYEQYPKLKPYIFHGVDLSVPKNSEALGECPFCGKENKFSVNVTNGKWKCWSCGLSGNVYTFLAKFHQLCIDFTKPEDYAALAKSRLYLDSQVLIEWGIAKSVTTDRWLVPGYNAQAHLASLYQQFREADGSYKLKPTPTLGHHLHGMNLWDAEKNVVFICEGPWDGMALWECLCQGKYDGSGELVPTASAEYSLYSQSNVIAVPGCEVFFEPWLPLFENKIVNLLYDSDHPRKHPKTGHITEGGGWRGMRRVTEMFVKSRYKPQELNCVYWGEENGYDPKLKSGFDVRDLLTIG